MTYQVKQSSTAYPLVFFMTDSSDHITGKTGLSPTVTIRKPGGSFVSPSGAVTEIGNGWYQVAGNATDTNTLGPLLLHATATGADPTDMVFEVVAHDPQDGVRLGLTALPNVTQGNAGALVTSGTGTGQISLSSGAVIIQSGTGTGQLSISSGVVSANVTQFGGSAGTFAGGRPEVNVSHFGGTAGTFSVGIPSVNTVQWRGVQPNNLTSGRVDVTVGAMQEDVITASAIAANAITSSELADSAAEKIRDAIKALIVESEGSITLQEAISIMLAVLAGETENGGNTFLTPNGGATRVTATTNADNEREAIVLNPSS